MNRSRIALVLVSLCILLAGCGESPAEPSVDAESSEEPAEEPVEAFALFVEGVPVATAAEEAPLQALLDARLEEYLASFDPESVLYGDFFSSVRVGEWLCLASEFSDEEELKAASESIRCVAAVLQKETYDIPFETCVIYERRTTEDLLLRAGETGVGAVTNALVIVDGEVTETRFVSDETEKEPVNEEILTGTEPETEQTVASTLFIKPYDGRLSSTYGETKQRTKAHQGIDIIAWPGSSCFRDLALAAADGTVVRAERASGYGNFVLIDHGNGLFTAYGHFDSLLVEKGQFVTAGTPIGKIGQTGQATGPHLHFEVRVGDRKINPLLFLPYTWR